VRGHVLGNFKFVKVRNFPKLSYWAAHILSQRLSSSHHDRIMDIFAAVAAIIAMSLVVLEYIIISSASSFEQEQKICMRGL
jgi:hypothetical protein